MLDLSDLIRIARRVVGPGLAIRDYGLLHSASARPKTTVFGQDAYLTIHEKAAALLHSVVSNRALVDGNKRLGLAAVIVFYGVNGYRLTFDNDAAFELIMQIVAGSLSDVRSIADRVASNYEPGLSRPEPA